jgi:hypothetical protein
VAPPERQYSTAALRGWMQNSSWKRSGGICRRSSLVSGGILCQIASASPDGIRFLRKGDCRARSSATFLRSR